MCVVSMHWVLHVVLWLISACSSEDAMTRYYADVTSDMQQWYHTGCVLLFMPSETNNKLLQLGKLMSKTNVMTSFVKLTDLNEMLITYTCEVNRPLFVLFSDEETRRYVHDMKTNIMSYPRWLLFLDQSMSKDAFFTDIDVPFDCEFVVAEQSRVAGDARVQQTEIADVVLTEVYRVAEGLALNAVTYATWNSDTRLKANKKTLYDRRNNMQAHAIKVAGLNFPPVTQLRRDSSGNITRITGYFGLIWHILEKHINFTTDLVEPPDTSFGALSSNGSWNGMIGMILDKKVHLALNEFTLTPQRLEAVDFLMPLIDTTINLYIRKPDTSNLQWNNAITPFVSSLWLGILGSVLLLSLALAGTYYIGVRSGSEHTQGQATFRLTDAVYHVLALFCQQGPDASPFSAASRTVSLLAGTTSIIFLAAYSAALTSFLSVQHTELPFKTFQGFIDDGSYKFGVRRNAIPLYFDEVRETNALYRDLYNKFVLPYMNKMALLSKTEGIRRVCNEKKQTWLSTAMFERNFFKQLTCDVVPIPDPFMRDTESIVIAKQSPYRRAIDHHLHCLRDAGVLKRLYDQFWPKPILTEGEPYSSITIYQVIAIVVVLALGITVSVTIVLVECSCNKNNRTYVSNQANIGKNNTKKPSDIMRVFLN